MPFWPFRRKSPAAESPVRRTTPPVTPPKPTAPQVLPAKRQTAIPPNTCPHCGVVLDIEPVRKRKCPECRQTIVPRQAPGSPVKRFYTEEQAVEVERQIEEARRQERLRELRIGLRLAEKGKDTHGALMARAEIANLEGRRDDAWRCLNEASTEACRTGQGGNYCYIRTRQAHQLLDEGRVTAALGFVCEVAYLGYCRVTNLPTDERGRPEYNVPFFDAYFHRELRKVGVRLEDEGPDPTFGYGSVEWLAELMHKNGILLEQIETVFMERCTTIEKGLRAPYKASIAWRELRGYLEA